MPTTADRHDVESPKRPGPRTASDERRRGIRLLIVSAVVLAAMLALWWLVATTNREGHHDAELLPIFTSIPLSLALYHLLRARLLRSKDARLLRSEEEQRRRG